MTKQRFEGRVRGSVYAILAPDGGALREIPLSEARGDSKLKAAIVRNGWEAIPQ